LRDELVSLREEVKKADQSAEGCRSCNQQVRRERDNAKKQRTAAEAELERVRGEDESNKQIVEGLRRELAIHVSAHAEFERLRTEVAVLGPRVTEQATEIKRLTQIGCRWKAHEQRAAGLRRQQGVLAELYECHYYRRRDYPHLVRKVAQLVHCVGKRECAVIVSLLGLPKDTAIKGWNHEMTEGLGFKFQTGDGLTRGDIERQVGIVCQMAKQIGVKVLAKDGTTPDQCVEFCVGVDAIKAAEKLSVDLSAREVKDDPPDEGNEEGVFIGE
jgi:hypothetical protein